MTAVAVRDVGGGWRVMEAALATLPAPRAALARNGTLGGFAKLALAADGTWQARAELPLGGLAFPSREAETATALAALLELRAIEPGIAAPPFAGRTPVPDLPPAIDPDEVAARCAAAGWPCTRLARERVALELGLPGLARARVATAPAEGRVRVAAELDRVRLPLDPRCERALVLLLLRAAAVVRLVRPVLAARAGRAAILFEVAYDRPCPEPGELAHAFAALRVAAETTSREARVLARDPGIAAAYLGVHDDGRAGDDGLDLDPAGPEGSAPTERRSSWKRQPRKRSTSRCGTCPDRST